MNFDGYKITNELLKAIDPELISRDVRISVDLCNTGLSVHILAGFGPTTTEHEKLVDLNDPASLTQLENWLVETLLEIRYR